MYLELLMIERSTWRLHPISGGSLVRYGGGCSCPILRLARMIRILIGSELLPIRIFRGPSNRICLRVQKGRKIKVPPHALRSRSRSRFAGDCRRGEWRGGCCCGCCGVVERGGRGGSGGCCWYRRCRCLPHNVGIADWVKGRGWGRWRKIGCGCCG